MLKTVIGKIRNSHQFNVKFSKPCPLNTIMIIGIHQKAAERMLRIILIIPKLVCCPGIVVDIIFTPQYGHKRASDGISLWQLGQFMFFVERSGG